MLTRYSTILPFSTSTFISWIQAPETLRSVSLARVMPDRRASSKPVFEAAVISVTRATDMTPPVSPHDPAGHPQDVVQRIPVAIHVDHARQPHSRGGPAPHEPSQ